MIQLDNVSMLVHIRSVVLLLYKYLLCGLGRNPGTCLQEDIHIREPSPLAKAPRAPPFWKRAS